MFFLFKEAQTHFYNKAKAFLSLRALLSEGFYVATLKCFLFFFVVFFPLNLKPIAFNWPRSSPSPMVPPPAGNSLSCWPVSFELSDLFMLFSLVSVEYLFRNHLLFYIMCKVLLKTLRESSISDTKYIFLHGIGLR